MARNPGRPTRRLTAVASLLGLFACDGGGGGGFSPIAATPTPTPIPTPTTFTLQGQVSEEPPFSEAIAGAKVEFVDGANAGKNAITDANGNYSISDLAQGGFTVRASAEGFQALENGITVKSNLRRDFALAVSGPRKRFGPGQYRVNSEIAAGRYYAGPMTYGCYFERQRGLGGTLDDIIANEFIQADASQWIVDIKSSDVGFVSDECGIWYNTPRAGRQAPVSDGMWLVGSQVPAGTYGASELFNCYWQRLRDFSNTLSGVIANDFVDEGGSKTLSIRSSDAGFSTVHCGTWTRTGNLLPEHAVSLDPASEIEYNWLRNRQRDSRLTTRP